MTQDEYRELFKIFQALNEENRILRRYISHKWGEEELKGIRRYFPYKWDDEEELKRRIEQAFSGKEGTE